MKRELSHDHDSVAVLPRIGPEKQWRKAKKTTPAGAEWREYPRIAPGVYRAYSAVAKFHFDESFGRWVCFIRWDVFTDGGRIVRIPLWYNLSKGKKPKAARRSKYFKEWVKANGGPPARGERLSPAVFRHRMALVEIDDTDIKKSPVPYSVVRKILEWETACRVTQSTSHTVKGGIS